MKKIIAFYCNGSVVFIKIFCLKFTWTYMDKSFSSCQTGDEEGTICLRHDLYSLIAFEAYPLAGRQGQIFFVILCPFGSMAE